MTHDQDADYAPDAADRIVSLPDALWIARYRASVQEAEANATALLDLWENGGPATITAAGEPFATQPIEDVELPDCEHCDGTGKNLTGSPWEDQR